jgi:hypothetical protein
MSSAGRLRKELEDFLEPTGTLVFELVDPL